MKRLIGTDAVLAAVDRVMVRPWDWARGHNCLGDVAEVVVDLGGPDLMTRLRGQYSDQIGALRIVANAGGMASLVAEECRAAGMVWAAAAPGSVSAAVGDLGETAVICLTPGMWVGKTPNGYAVIPVEIGGWSWLF